MIFIDRINRLNNLSIAKPSTRPIPAANSPCRLMAPAFWVRSTWPSWCDDRSRRRRRLDLDELERLVAIAVRMMDNVIDISSFPLEEQRHEALAKRRIGLGVTGLADALIFCGARYGRRRVSADRTLAGGTEACSLSRLGGAGPRRRAHFRCSTGKPIWPASISRRCRRTFSRPSRSTASGMRC